MIYRSLLSGLAPNTLQSPKTALLSLWQLQRKQQAHTPGVSEGKGGDRKEAEERKGQEKGAGNKAVTMLREMVTHIINLSPLPPQLPPSYIKQSCREQFLPTPTLHLPPPW